VNATITRVRDVLGGSRATGSLPEDARLYVVDDLGVAVAVALIAEPKAIGWCDHYLAPFVASRPVGEGIDGGYVVDALHDAASWQELHRAVSDLDATPSQTYNGTPIREWALAEGLHVQQYVGRGSFTVIDVVGRRLTFVDDGVTDSEWWMEPSRLVREIVTRQLEEHSQFVFHAASVALGDVAAALIGPKRAGKTTLTVAALEHVRAAYIANDRTYVGIESGIPAVRGWPVTAAFGIGTCLASPTMRSYLEGGVRSCYPQPALASRLDLDEFGRRDVAAKMHERVKIELTPLEIGETFGVSVVPSRRLGAIVFPKLDPSCGTPELRSVAAPEAASLLSDQVLTCDEIEYRLAAPAPGLGCGHRAEGGGPRGRAGPCRARLRAPVLGCCTGRARAPRRVGGLMPGDRCVGKIEMSEERTQDGSGGVIEATKHGDTSERVRRVVEDVVGRAPDADGEDLRDVGLDSFMVVELTIALETEFSIVIPDEQLQWCSLETIDRISATVQGLLTWEGGET
jgi:acyl carrier protein